MVEVSRGEFELLRQMVAEQGSRLTSIDNHGTRGVGVVQAQLTEVIKDLAELKVQFDNEKKSRSAGRRWAIGLGVAATGAIGGLVSALLSLLARIH